MFGKTYLIVGGVILAGYACIGLFGWEFGSAKMSSSPPSLHSGRSGGGYWGGGGFGGGK